jgi:hypothetical protein
VSILTLRASALALTLSALVLSAGCGGSGSDDDPAPAPTGSQIVVARSGTLATHLIVPRSTAGSTGSTTFVTGPATPPIGTGSVQFSIGSDGNSGEELRFRAFHGGRLDQITHLSYWTYTQVDGVGGQTVYLILTLDWDGDGAFDDLLFFEPEYQHGYTAIVPDQGPNLVGVWQDWNALAGGWWSINEPAHQPGANVNTIAAYLALHPNATIVPNNLNLGGVRLTAGLGAPSWDNFVGNADALAIGVNGTVYIYDFEP